MPDIQEIVDEQGVIRRLGSLPMPEGMVSAFPVFENTVVPWSDADIRRALSDPNRVRSRIEFGDRWIMNQGSHGSCNGHAAAEAFARARWKSGIRDGLLFSGAWIYSLINGHRDSGSVLEDGMQAGLRNGFAPADLVTPDMIYPERQPKDASTEAAKHKSVSAYKCQTIAGFRTGIAAGYLGVVAVNVGNTFSRLNSRGICGIDPGGGNHAVCVDDAVIDQGDELYDMPNSWGLSFGQRGRGFLTLDHFKQTFDRHAFYVIPIGGAVETV